MLSSDCSSSASIAAMMGGEWEGSLLTHATCCTSVSVSSEDNVDGDEWFSCVFEESMHALMLVVSSLPAE